MQSINNATMMTLDSFRKKADTIPFSEHPYSANKRALLALGKTEWDERHRDSATAALAIWVKTIILNSTVAVLNEIVALMKIAANNGDDAHKKAADEMASSMDFVEKVFATFVTEINCTHIAEQLFADGLKKEQEIAAETAAAEAAKEKVKAFNEAKQPHQAEAQTGTVHRPNRWEPSQN